MRPKNEAKKKTGFQEGRSATTSGSSSSRKSKKNKADRKQDKLKRAQSDLADALNELTEDPDSDGAIDDIEVFSKKFERDIKRLRKSVINAGEDFNADAASRTLLKTLFAMNVKLIPIAEQAYRSSKKETAMYALMAIEKQVLELSAELKLLGNVEHQSEFISTKIIRPIFMAIIQTAITECMSLKNNMDLELQPKSAKKAKTHVDEMIRNISSFMDKSSKKLGSDIASYLGGDMQFMSEDKGKKKKRGG